MYKKKSQRILMESLKLINPHMGSRKPNTLRFTQQNTVEAVMYSIDIQSNDFQRVLDLAKPHLE